MHRVEVGRYVNPRDNIEQERFLHYAVLFRVYRVQKVHQTGGLGTVLQVTRAGVMSRHTVARDGHFRESCNVSLLHDCDRKQSNVISMTLHIPKPQAAKRVEQNDTTRLRVDAAISCTRPLPALAVPAHKSERNTTDGNTEKHGQANREMRCQCTGTTAVENKNNRGGGATGVPFPSPLLSSSEHRPKYHMHGMT